MASRESFASPSTHGQRCLAGRSVLIRDRLGHKSRHSPYQRLAPLYTGTAVFANGFPSRLVGHISVTHMHQDDRIFQRTPCTAYRLNRSRRVTARVHPGVAIHRLPPAVERRPALALRVAHRQYGVAEREGIPAAGCMEEQAQARRPQRAWQNVGARTGSTVGDQRNPLPSIKRCAPSCGRCDWRSRKCRER